MEKRKEKKTLPLTTLHPTAPPPNKIHTFISIPYHVPDFKPRLFAQTPKFRLRFLFSKSSSIAIPVRLHLAQTRTRPPLPSPPVNTWQRLVPIKGHTPPYPSAESSTSARAYLSTSAGGVFLTCRRRCLLTYTRGIFLREYGRYGSLPQGGGGG